MRVINYKRHAVLPQRLVAYVTQSISYQTQSSRLLFITGYVWAVNPVRQKTSEGICHCGPPGRTYGGGAPGTPEQGLFSPSQAAGEVPGPSFHSSQYTRWGGANRIQFVQGVQGTREAPGVENAENNKIRAREVCKLVGEKEAGARQKRGHNKSFKQLYLASVHGL